MQTTMINVHDGLQKVLQRKKKLYPQHVNRISALDDPCLRRLYYMRTAWDKASETEDSLQGIFETGSTLEPVIERIVSEIGMESTPRWRIIGTQTATNDNLLKEYQISGTIDGFLQVENGQWKTQGVVDIKTMSPNIFPQINSFDDLRKYPWTRKYRGQLMLYALAHNLETCFLLLVNKTNLFDIKVIDFPVDMGYCDNLLAKAQSVNDAIANQEPPEGINDPDECPRCKFYSHCCPDITTGGNLQISDSEELETILERLAELEPYAKEYRELERARDSMLTKGQDLVCGRFLVTWKQIEVNYKAKEARTQTQWRKKIVKR